MSTTGSCSFILIHQFALICGGTYCKILQPVICQDEVCQIRDRLCNPLMHVSILLQADMGCASRVTKVPHLPDVVQSWSLCCY